jgi:hypothetical protein
MSHFYRQRSYTYDQTDQMLKEIKDEMSNFLTKEEAELILNRRNALVDPIPYQDQKINAAMIEELHHLRNMFFRLDEKLDNILKKLDE